MVDFGGNNPPQSLEDLLLKHLRPGDILTHMYAHVNNRTPIVDEQGKVRPYVLAARKRGIIFDAGHGGGSFLFRQAVPAMKQGFTPDVISTDLHSSSMNGGMKDILNTMSKFLNLGMPLTDVVKANTAARRRGDQASRARPPERGRRGRHRGARACAAATSASSTAAATGCSGDQKLECELTIKAGQVVWDLNGLSRPMWNETK